MYIHTQVLMIINLYELLILYVLHVISFYLNRYDRVGQMSGGERRRLQLLQVLARAPNVLLLDEPSKYLRDPTH